MKATGGDIFGAVLAAALPALIATWGFIVFVFLTNPIRPFATGGVLELDLLVLAVVGFVAAIRRTPKVAVVGVSVGLAVAVAIQLFILAGQASFNSSIVAELPEPPWATQVWIALLLALVAAWIGCGAAAVARRSLRRPPVASQASSGVTAAATVLAAILVTGGLIGEASHSGYVVAASEPTIRVTVDGGRITNLDPSVVPVGRTGIVVEQNAAGDYVQVAGPPSADAPTPVTPGRTTGPLNLIGGLRAAGGLEQVEFRDPGTYAVVLISAASLTDHEESMDILDVRSFQVGPDVGAITTTTSAVLTVGAGAALVIAALAAAGAVLYRRRPAWSSFGRPRSRDLRWAALAGAAHGGILWFLALFAIDLSHNPF